MAPSSAVRAVCIGEHTVDAVVDTRDPSGPAIRLTPGGAAGGTACFLAGLGIRVTSMGSVGSDPLADFLVSEMVARGVDARLTRRQHGSAPSVLRPRQQGQRPPLLWPDAAARLDLTELGRDPLDDTDLVHLGGLESCGAFADLAAASLFEEAKRAGVTTSLEVSSAGGATAAPLLPTTDVVVVDAEALRYLAGTDDPRTGAQWVLDRGPRGVLVRCGDIVVVAGSTQNGPVALPAGRAAWADAITAGFVLGIVLGLAAEDAGWVGAAAVALAAEGRGGERAAELASLAVHLAPADVAGRVMAALGGASGAGRSQAGLPDYAALPPAPDGGRSGWGVFGSTDSVGLFNLQTPARVVAGARLVRTGEVFSLNAPLDVPQPPFFGRGAVAPTLLSWADRSGFDDKLDNLYPQASSQWDSLAHVGYAADAFYNGATAEDIEEGRRNTIDHWAKRGIAGRAVLLDVEAVLGGAGRGFDPSATTPVSVVMLEEARRVAGVEFVAGDVLLLHTGYLRWYTEQDGTTRNELAAGSLLRSVGIERTEAMAAYLWDAHVAAIASDNPAVEVWPPDRGGGPFGFLHRMLIGQFGMALGELWWLDDLARSCRRDGRYEALITAAPLHRRGGIGSPANALAIK